MSCLCLRSSVKPLHCSLCNHTPGTSDVITFPRPLLTPTSCKDPSGQHGSTISCLTSSHNFFIAKQNIKASLNISSRVCRLNSPPVSDCHWPGLPPRTRSPRQLQHKDGEIYAQPIEKRHWEDVTCWAAAVCVCINITPTLCVLVFFRVRREVVQVICI